MFSNKLTIRFIPALCLSVVTGCVTAGTHGTAVSGAGSGSTSVGANPTLERCSKSLGTLAVDDGRAASWYGDFDRDTQVTTVEPLIRLAIQQSNCFVITSIGNLRTNSRMKNITGEQRNSGEYRANSKQHKGQRVAADYYMEPQIILQDSPLASFGGAVIDYLGPHLGTARPTVDMKSSVVTLSLFDLRSSVQLAISEGSATSTSFGAAFTALGGGRSASLSGFSRTSGGKATVAAFTDAYNQMVRAVRNYRAQDVKGGLGTGGTLTVN